ncbi:hypothetical protein HHK36_032245 [Tetracentron sinense]|uniref:Uncharacterized protein n=1 Tax=Tetracentron sinense TaxID=13715 RepID=A0A834Y5H0_TETSI|nr:hypothetical protein HHK36_032245 [Tetracentron sinense]
MEEDPAIQWSCGEYYHNKFYMIGSSSPPLLPYKRSKGNSKLVEDMVRSEPDSSTIKQPKDMSKNTYMDQRKRDILFYISKERCLRPEEELYYGLQDENLDFFHDTFMVAAKVQHIAAATGMLRRKIMKPDSTSASSSSNACNDVDEALDLSASRGNLNL